MASIPGVRFDITGASGSQGLLSPRSSWRAYVFPRGGYASQDSTGATITFDSAAVASRFATNDWVQVGLSTANIRQVSGVGGNSIGVNTAVTVSENDRIFLIGNTEPTVNGGSATYTVPNTLIRQRDDDGSDLYTNSMVTTNSDGLVQFFSNPTIYDVLVQDGNQANQGYIAELPVGISSDYHAFFGVTVTIHGALGVTGWATFGQTVTMNAALGVTGAATFGATASAVAFLSKDNPFANVKHPDYGAKGDGSTDDTAAIQAAITGMSDTGGIVFFPPGVYIINSPLVMDDSITLLGSGSQQLAGSTMGTQIKAGGSWSGTALITDQGSGTSERGMAVRHMVLKGSASVTNGILWDNDEYCTVEDVFCNTFQGAGIYLKTTTGNVGSLRDVIAQNCVQASSLSGRIGAVTVEWADCYLDSITATASATSYAESGNRVGILVAGANCFATNSVGHSSEDGFVISGGQCKIANCRADLNRGHGFVVLTSGGNQFSNCHSLNNGMQTANTYDSFRAVVATNNLFTNCLAQTSGSTAHRYGFLSSATSDTGTSGNRFIGCRSIGHGTQFYGNTTSSTMHEWAIPEGSLARATADDATPSVANSRFLRTAGSTSAVEYTALDDGVSGQVVTIHIASSTNPPTIADGVTFLLSGAFTGTLNDTITLYTPTGTSWHEISRSAN